MPMPSPHPIRWLRAHPFAADSILATVITATALLLHLLADDTALDGAGTPISEPTWWSPLLLVAASAPVAWRRRRPLEVVLVVTTAQVAFEALDFDGTGFVGLLIAVYSAGAHSVGETRTRTMSVVGVLILGLFVAGLAIGELGVADFIASTVVCVTAFILGDNLRRRRDTAVALAERAERAERERELVAQQQVGAERSRIARELHDVVAHSVSVMVIQAAAARRSLASSPADAEQALTNIEETGRRTMNELRGILGVLRPSEPEPGGGQPPTAPQPTLGDLESLVRVSDDLPITLSTDGAFDDLPDSVTLTGYRAVQEALTNIRRHAGPVTRVEVAVVRHDDHLEITIVDDGRGAAADDSGPGYGLLGMSERVQAVGGSLAAGARRGGGWSVAVHLPARSTGPLPTAVSETHA